MASNIKQVDPWKMLDEQRISLVGYAAEINRLQAEIRRMHALEEKLLAQKPVAWVRYTSDGSIQGPLLDSKIDVVRREFWTPLIVAEWVNRDAQSAQDGADSPHLSAQPEDGT